MNKKILLSTIMLCVAAYLFASDAWADPKFSWGPYLRIRHEFWKNISDMENSKLDNRNYFRIKTSLWGQLDADENTIFYLKMTNENKAYAYWGVNSTGNKNYRYDINELVFDNLYAEFRKIIGTSLDLKIGRQDLSSGSYGEGFIFADGTPRDGSRTNYFNAIKTTWHVNDKNALEFIYIKNNKSDDLLPVANRMDGEQMLNYSDERAFVLYHKADSIKNTHLENYYILKREDAGRPAPLTQKSTINTFGSFAKVNLAFFTLRGQFAYQFGTYGADDRQGFGGYVYLDRDFSDKIGKPQASLGYTYLSGDDGNTAKLEGFSQLFSTYTWMSDLYNMSYQSETGTSYWTNLQMVRATINFVPFEKSKITLTYNYLLANEPQTSVNTGLFGTGKERGHLPIFRFDYAINKNISTYFLAEYFIPGNFYVDTSDEALFLRTEIQFKF